MKSVLRKIIGSTSAALVVAVGAAVLAAPNGYAAPAYPFADPDPFYNAPADVGTRADGDVLASRSVAATGFPTAEAWQIQYKSTNSAGVPIAAVTTVLVPRGAPVNRPLVSYQPFVNSLGLQCAPSHQLFVGGLQETPALNALLARGWAVAVPDHLGPSSAYGAAKLGGRLVLDGIRAAQRLPQTGLGAGPVGLAGYSGGAMATNWAAALAPTYSPELNIVGAAQGGTPVNIGELADRLGGTPSDAFGLGFAAAIGLEREYPTRSPLGNGLNVEGLQLRDRMSNLCTDSILAAGAGMSLAELTDGPSILTDPSGRSVMDENSVQLYPGVPRTPMYVWHGSADPLVNIGPVRETVDKYCAQGARVQFDVIPGADHGSATVLGVGPAFSYLGDRFAGIPAPSNC
ncbi:lipase family protein [Rhodococcus sp. USK13]|uniref:lipase family protein n=1 Tax=Rhodococcus sp. USK13 TaxID=2806442 RepID=UPI001BCF5E1D|nr:lipase family protein [Rhodococcus sp. USK13]